MELDQEMPRAPREEATRADSGWESSRHGGGWHRTPLQLSAAGAGQGDVRGSVCHLGAWLLTAGTESHIRHQRGTDKFPPTHHHEQF